MSSGDLEGMISHLESTVGHYVENFGVDEHEAKIRIARSPAYGELSGWIETTYGEDDRFGGVWIDQEAGGTLVVATTSERAFEELGPAIAEQAGRVAAKYDQDRESIGSLLGVEVSLPFGPKIVEHSYRSLMETGRAVQEAHRELGIPDASMEYVVLPMQNAVEVTLYSDYEEATRVGLQQRLDTHPSVQLVENPAMSTEQRLADCPLSDCIIQGGVYYKKDATGLLPGGAANGCSMGFTGVRNGEVGFYSAGHCVWVPPLGLPFSGNQTPVPHFVVIGGSEQQVGVSKMASNHAINGQRIDLSFVGLNAVGQAIVDPGHFWNPFGWTPVVDAPQLPRSSAALGDVFCRSGFREEDDHLPHCGQLYAKTPAGYVSNTTACPGDSGGPFFRQSDQVAVGVAHSIPAQGLPPGTPIPCPTLNMSFVTFSFLSDALAEIGGAIDGK